MHTWTSIFLSSFILMGNVFCLETVINKYVTWNNHAQADIDALLDDPLLVIRTKHTGMETQHDVKASWEQVSKFQAGELELSEKKSEAQNEDLEQHFEANLEITAKTNYNYEKPTFEILTKDKGYQTFHWQISSDLAFKEVLGNFDEVTKEHKISLSDLAETFLNPKETYFIHVRGLKDGQWGLWSAPAFFEVSKPEQVEEVTFDKVKKGVYTLAWDGSEDSAVRYFVFGSNSKDFVPEIYYPTHISKIENGEIVEFQENKNFILSTSETEITIDDRFAYYRILSEKNGQFGNPSPLVYVYDNEMELHTDVLCLDKLTHIPKRSFLNTTLFSSPQAIGEPKKSPYVSEEIWKEVKPYIMPENHPLKAKLDRIFASKRILLNHQSLVNAGFINIRPSTTPNKVVVCKNTKFPGYVFKMYTDHQPEPREYARWVKRCTGIKAIQECIDRHNFNNLFVLPKKWIYQLPAEPSPPHGTNRKNFILVAENMHILSSIKNRTAWKGRRMSSKVMDKLFIIFKEVGLADSVFCFNVPFTRKGKLTFIDTEVHHRWPVPYHTLTKYFSMRKKYYWNHLIKHNGPSRNY